MSAVDFSPRAVSRAVLAKTLQRPHVLYPTALGILGGVAAAVIAPSLVFLAPAAIGLSLGIGGWALDYGLQRNKHAAEYLRRLQEVLAGRVNESVQRLRKEFEELRYEPGLKQLEQLRVKFEAFETLLRRKLNPQELSFTRYLGITEQVFLAGLDNLTRITDTLRGLAAIDVGHIDKRLKTLTTDGIESAQQDREIAALEERRALVERQRAQIDGLSAENEQAMTQIDHAMAAIASMDTAAAHASMDMEAAMDELRRLAQRAPSYSNKR